MENELNILEGKLVQLIQVCSNLRAENHRIRQELAHAQSSNRQCNDQLESAHKNLKNINAQYELINGKLEIAKGRLEKLLITLPADAT